MSLVRSAAWLGVLVTALVGCASGSRPPALAHHEAVSRPEHHTHDHDHAHGHHHHALLHAHAANNSAAICACDGARRHNGWCAACRVGYVAGVPVKSADLFDAIDAHGHEFIASTIECPTCRAAVDSEGFCEQCLIGFAQGQLYCSKVSYSLAWGEPIDPVTLACERCRRGDTAPQWCDSCQRGVVGNHAFRDRVRFNLAVAEFRRLIIAIETLQRCEPCAVVMITGGPCPVCSSPDLKP